MSNNEYLITRHAKRRMKERKITFEQLKSVIKNPDNSDIGNRGEVRAEEIFQPGEIIKVIYIKEKEKKIIITAMRR
jgi:hypothetical protein